MQVEQFDSLTLQLQTLTDSLQDYHSLEIEGEIKSSIQFLSELIDLNKPDEQKEQERLQRHEEHMQLLVSLNDNIETMNVTLQDNHQELLIELEEKMKTDVEGYYFISLAFVISLGIYMFWNQLSKW